MNHVEKHKDYSVLFDFGSIEFKVYFWEVEFDKTDEEFHALAVKELEINGVKLPEEKYMYEVCLERC